MLTTSHTQATNPSLLSSDSLLSKASMMSSVEMASNTSLSYQRLRPDDEVDEIQEDGPDITIRRTRSWSRYSRRFSFRKRVRVRFLGSRRFFKRRIKVVSYLRLSIGKIIKRFKESGAHFGDLFAGNYMFMQVTPTSFKYIEKSMANHQGFPARVA